MKRIAASLLLPIVLVLTGCNQGSPGGPGADNMTNKRPAVGQVSNSFNLNPPMMQTTLKQGETKIVSLGIKRGADFDQDVSIKFSELPKGMKIDPSSPVIKHGEEEAKLTVMETTDAALGDFQIVVTGHPSKGADAIVILKLGVNAK